MRDWDLGQVRPGMDVFDFAGEKVGTVAHIHPQPPEAGGEGAPAGEDVLDVKTGLLGLGTHFYVPAGGVEELTTAGVVLNRRRAEFAELGWDAKPGYLGATR